MNLMQSKKDDKKHDKKNSRFYMLQCNDRLMHISAKQNTVNKLIIRPKTEETTQDTALSFPQNEILHHHLATYIK